MNSNALKASIW